MELIIVVLIMGIMAAVAVPSYVDSVCRYRVQASARRLATDLEVARQNAQTESIVQTVIFQPGNHSYSLQGLTSLKGDAYDVQLAKTQYPASIVSVDFGGDVQFDYNIFGRPTVGGTVVLECGGYQKTVRVNAVTGRTTVE